jgi:hypothetical protein
LPNIEKINKGDQVMTTGQNGSQKIETRIGTLEFTHDFANGFPAEATVEKHVL